MTKTLAGKQLDVHLPHLQRLSQVDYISPVFPSKNLDSLDWRTKELDRNGREGCVRGRILFCLLYLLRRGEVSGSQALWVKHFTLPYG